MNSLLTETSKVTPPTLQAGPAALSTNQKYCPELYSVCSQTFIIEKVRETSYLCTKGKQKVKSKKYNKPAILEALELGTFEVWHMIFQRIIPSSFNI